MATRRTFDPNAPEGPAPAVSRIPTFKCAAYGCKLAGGLNGGGADWWCAFHYAVPPLDLPRVTSILVEHVTVVRELVELQQLLRDHPTDGRAHQAQMGLAMHHIEIAGHADIVDSLPAGRWPTAPDRFAQALHAYLGGKVIGVRRLRNKSEIPTGYRMQRAPAQPVSDFIDMGGQP